MYGLKILSPFILACVFPSDFSGCLNLPASVFRGIPHPLALNYAITFAVLTPSRLLRVPRSYARNIGLGEGDTDGTEITER